MDTNSPSLLIRTKALLTESEETTSEISIGSGVSYPFLINLEKGANKSASVDRVQAVYEYLSGEALFDDTDEEYVFDL